MAHLRKVHMFTQVLTYSLALTLVNQWTRSEVGKEVGASFHGGWEGGFPSLEVWLICVWSTVPSLMISSWVT